MKKRIRLTEADYLIQKTGASRDDPASQHVNNINPLILLLCKKQLMNKNTK